MGLLDLPTELKDMICACLCHHCSNFNFEPRNAPLCNLGRTSKLLNAAAAPHLHHTVWFSLRHIPWIVFENRDVALNVRHIDIAIDPQATWEDKQEIKKLINKHIDYVLRELCDSRANSNKTQTQGGDDELSNAKINGNTVIQLLFTRLPNVKCMRLASNPRLSLFGTIEEQLKHRPMRLQHLQLCSHDPIQLNGLYSLLRQPSLCSITLDKCIHSSVRKRSLIGVKTITHSRCDDKACRVGKLVFACPNLKHFRLQYTAPEWTLAKCSGFTQKLWLEDVDSYYGLGGLKSLKELSIQGSPTNGKVYCRALPPKIEVLQLRGEMEWEEQIIKLVDGHGGLKEVGVAWKATRRLKTKLRLLGIQLSTVERAFRSECKDCGCEVD